MCVRVCIYKPKPADRYNHVKFVVFLFSFTAVCLQIIRFFVLCASLSHSKKIKTTPSQSQSLLCFSFYFSFCVFKLENEQQNEVPVPSPRERPLQVTCYFYNFILRFNVYMRSLTHQTNIKQTTQARLMTLFYD